MDSDLSRPESAYIGVNLRRKPGSVPGGIFAADGFGPFPTGIGVHRRESAAKTQFGARRNFCRRWTLIHADRFG